MPPKPYFAAVSSPFPLLPSVSDGRAIHNAAEGRNCVGKFSPSSTSVWPDSRWVLNAAKARFAAVSSPLRQPPFKPLQRHESYFLRRSVPPSSTSICSWWPRSPHRGRSHHLRLASRCGWHQINSRGSRGPKIGLLRRRHGSFGAEKSLAGVGTSFVRGCPWHVLRSFSGKRAQTSRSLLWKL